MATKKKTKKRDPLMTRVMPYTVAALRAAEEWLDASGVGDDLGDDADAILETLAEAFTNFKFSTGGP